MTRLRLRPWQHEALAAFERDDARDFLAVATPGAGKTMLAAAAAARDLRRRPHRRVLVVAPTSHLKTQWTHAAARVGLQLEPSWASGDPWPGDFHGVVVTYQQAAHSPAALRAVAEDAFVVLDEVHHAGSGRAWGEALGHAFEHAARRLSLSGTPFRSDDDPIPFVTYEQDVARPDHVYGYGDALREGGVVRPVFFPRVDGAMEWTAPDGQVASATFADELDRARVSQRLRTALSLDGQWLPDVLARADDALARLRETHPAAGGLVIAADVEHARGIAQLLRMRGRRTTVAVSDDADASARIAAFRDGDDPWIVAVRMVSEGVDIPRLRVGVWATTTVTELFFRQAVGRLVRWTPGLRRQKAFFYLPDDVRLRAFAARVSESRTHSLRRREEEADEQQAAEEDDRPGEQGEQPSLFAVISATATEEREPSMFDDDHPEDLVHDAPAETSGPEIDVAPPPPPLARAGAADAGVPRAAVRAELRSDNADRVHLLVRLTGLAPQAVNAELNQRARLAGVGDATVDQLRRRLAAADDWLARA